MGWGGGGGSKGGSCAVVMERGKVHGVESSRGLILCRNETFGQLRNI